MKALCLLNGVLSLLFPSCAEVIQASAEYGRYKVSETAKALHEKEKQEQWQYQQDKLRMSLRPTLPELLPDVGEAVADASIQTVE